MTAVRTRALAPADADAAGALVAALPEWFTPDVPGRVREAVVAGGGVAAVDASGVLRGFLTLAPVAGEPGVEEITWMAVDRALHRAGVGRALVEAAVGAAARRGATAVVVSTLAATTEYEPYERTRRFYAACGFAEARLDADAYGPGADRVVLRRDVRSS